MSSVLLHSPNETIGGPNVVSSFPKKMEQLYESFDQLRLLIRNLQTEIITSIRFRKEFGAFLSNLAERHPFEYSLATTRQKRPLYFEDAKRLEDGRVVSETYECLLVVRNLISSLNNYTYILDDYILALVRINNSLVRGMELFRDSYTNCILENNV